MSGQIKVLFVPSWRSGNPYQDLLAFSLRRHGVDVTIGRYELTWPALFRTIKKYAPCDIIHLHWISPYMIWFLSSKGNIKRLIKYLMCVIDMFLVRLSGKKIVWTVHNKFMHESSELFWEKKIRRMFVRYSNMILVHSTSAIKEIEESYGVKNTNNYSVIPHGHYIDVYPNSVGRNKAREILGLKVDSVVFIYFGAIKPYKGILRLIREFKDNPKLTNATLLIVGKSPASELEDKIIRMTSGVSNIKTFLKFVPREEVQVYMNAADIAIFPFEDILTSGSVILAMSFAKAVIVPKKGCLVDLLDTKGAIFFNDDNTLSMALEKALEADFGSMGKRNKEVITRNDWDKIGLSLKIVYEKL